MKCLKFISKPQNFRNQMIDGASLLLLSENHLTDNLHMNLGPALKLRSFLAEKTKASPNGPHRIAQTSLRAHSFSDGLTNNGVIDNTLLSSVTNNNSSCLNGNDYKSVNLNYNSCKFKSSGEKNSNKFSNEEEQKAQECMYGEVCDRGDEEGPAADIGAHSPNFKASSPSRINSSAREGREVPLVQRNGDTSLSR